MAMFVLARKPNTDVTGKWRVAIDSRHVNALTVEEHFPTPTTGDLLPNLNGISCLGKANWIKGY